jgi:hypothetical protein
MSLQRCQAGTTTGFPITLSQNINKEWAGVSGNTQEQIKQLIVPTDFTVQWGHATESAQIQVNQTPSVFQISGFNTVSDNTTLTYGSAIYSCSEVLSLVQNQHKTLSSHSDANYELILAFQINNKAHNPSSPDVILLSRPVVFNQLYTTPFWKAVNTSTKTGKSQRVAFDMSQIYGYSSSVLLPMISYQTCIPVKILNYKATNSQLASLSVRVHVCTQPMYVMSDDSVTAKCSSVTKYTLITSPKRPLDIFQDAAVGAILQFQDGLGKDRFPSGANENLVPLGASAQISAFQNVIKLLQVLVPEEFLGKSLAEIAEAKEHTPVVTKKKAFKCYRIDPNTDIKDDQILIDPTTGLPLKDTLAQNAYDDSGGDPALLDGNINNGNPGVMPGDIQTMLTNLFIFVGTVTLLAYLAFIAHTLLYRQDFHTGLYNIVIFIVLLTVLSSIGYYLDT